MKILGHSINNKLDFNRTVFGVFLLIYNGFFLLVFLILTHFYMKRSILFEKIKKSNKKVLLSNRSSIIHFGSKSTNSNNFDVTKNIILKFKILFN